MKDNINLETEKLEGVTQQEVNTNQSPLTESLRRHFLKWEPSVIRPNLEEEDEFKYA